MTISNKYEFEELSYGTEGWNAIQQTNMEIVEDNLHSILRYPVASGETPADYDPLCVINGEWHKALADGNKQPAVAIAIEGENWVSGEQCRGQHQGSITNTAWSLGTSGEVYLAAAGGLTKTKPATYAQVVGFVVNPTTLLICPSDLEETTTAGTGEANTASNLGAGEGLYAQKSSVDLQFKSLKAGSNISLTASGTEVEVGFSGELVNLAAKTPKTLGNQGYDCQRVYLDQDGEVTSFGQLLSLNAGGTAILANSASGEAMTKLPASFMATGSGSGEHVVLMPPGFVRNDSWSLTPGALLYVDPNTAGGMSHTVPSISGEKVQLIGRAYKSNKIYFNPSLVIIEL